MKDRYTFRAACMLPLFLLISILSRAQSATPDTVTTGIYITSIHDIDFRQNEYDVNFWLWMKYRNRDLDFQRNLEIPQAKSFETSFSTIDTSGEKVYMLVKVHCVMKDNWKIGNFPFDRQTLRLSIENSQFDARSLVFVPDTSGAHFDKRFTLRGWAIDSFLVSSGIKPYETAFGDPASVKPYSEYSSFRVRIVIRRDANDLFWKMFLGMFVAILIAYICFYIHVDNIDSRFALSVGSLFAVIGNKYIIDSSLPESTTFTLVDTLHGVSLLFIFLVTAATAWSLYLFKQDKLKQANRFDMYIAQIMLLIYTGVVWYFIAHAKG